MIGSFVIFQAKAFYTDYWIETLGASKSLWETSKKKQVLQEVVLVEELGGFHLS